MKFKKLFAAGLCLSMLAGCGAVKTNPKTESTAISTTNEEKSNGGLNITHADANMSNNLGISLAEMNVIMGQKAVPVSGQVDTYGYPVLYDQTNGYSYAVFVLVDSEELLRSVLVAFEGPNDDDEFRLYALNEAFTLFNRLPDCDITSFAYLADKLELVSENEFSAADVFGNYAAKMSLIVNPNDTSLIYLQMIPWTQDRAAGDPTPEDVEREADFEMTDDEVMDILKNGNDE